jgi:hypothetical protein
VWALEEAHRKPACREASYHCAANLDFDGLSPVLLFIVTDTALATDSSSVPTHACRRQQMLSLLALDACPTLVASVQI